MGKVTDELVELITKQVDDRGIVVWYDPEEAYGDVAAGLALPGREKGGRESLSD